MASKEDLLQQIRYLRDVENLSFRQMATKLGICRNALSRIYSGDWKEQRMQREFLLDAHRDLILHWYQECPSLNAMQVCQRLLDRSVGVSYATVARYTKAFRKKPKQRLYWPLEFLPGEEGQVDWFFITHPRLGKLCGFAMILSYSRYLFAHLFQRHSFEFFVEGHLMALKAFGGCPHALRYDNLKSVVLCRQPLTYKPEFLEVARHFGFEIRLCNVAAGNEKGRVERVIRTMKGSFFNEASSHQSLRALNADLHDWVQRKNATVHRVTEVRPIDKLSEEKLKPLPDGVWQNVVIHPPKLPTKTGLVIFDTNAYSYPDYLGRHAIVVRSSPDRVELYAPDGRKVASHERSFERNKRIINPTHRTVARLSLPAKRERILSVMRNLDPIMARFFEAHQVVGEDPCVQAHDLFLLLKAHSKAAVISAVREALTNGSPRTAYVRALLEPISDNVPATVSPRDRAILHIDYQPRPLEDYDDHSHR